MDFNDIIFGKEEDDIQTRVSMEDEQNMNKSLPNMALIRLKMGKTDVLLKQWNDKMKEYDTLLMTMKSEKQDLLDECNITTEKLTKLEMLYKENEKTAEKLKQMSEQQKIKLEENAQHINQLVCKVEDYDEINKKLKDEVKALQHDIKTSKIQAKALEKKPTSQTKHQFSQTSFEKRTIAVNTDDVTIGPKKLLVKHKGTMTVEKKSIQKEPFPIYCSKCEDSITPAPVEQILKIMTSNPPQLLSQLSPPKSQRIIRRLYDSSGINSSANIQNSNQNYKPLLSNENNSAMKISPIREMPNNTSLVDIKKLTERLNKLEDYVKKSKKRAKKQLHSQSCFPTKNIQFLVQLPGGNSSHEYKDRNKIEKLKVKSLKRLNKVVKKKKKKTKISNDWIVESYERPEKQKVKSQIKKLKNKTKKHTSQPNFNDLFESPEVLESSTTTLQNNVDKDLYMSNNTLSPSKLSDVEFSASPEEPMELDPNLDGEFSDQSSVHDEIFDSTSNAFNNQPSVSNIVVETIEEVSAQNKNRINEVTDYSSDESDTIANVDDTEKMNQLVSKQDSIDSSLPMLENHESPVNNSETTNKIIIDDIQITDDSEESRAVGEIMEYDYSIPLSVKDIEKLDVVLASNNSNKKSSTFQKENDESEVTIDDEVIKTAFFVPKEEDATEEINKIIASAHKKVQEKALIKEHQDQLKDDSSSSSIETIEKMQESLTKTSALALLSDAHNIETEIASEKSKISLNFEDTSESSVAAASVEIDKNTAVVASETIDVSASVTTFENISRNKKTTASEVIEESKIVVSSGVNEESKTNVPSHKIDECDIIVVSKVIKRNEVKADFMESNKNETVIASEEMKESKTVLILEEVKQNEIVMAPNVIIGSKPIIASEEMKKQETLIPSEVINENETIKVSREINKNEMITVIKDIEKSKAIDASEKFEQSKIINVSKDVEQGTTGITSKDIEKNENITSKNVEKCVTPIIIENVEKNGLETSKNTVEKYEPLHFEDIEIQEVDIDAPRIVKPRRGRKSLPAKLKNTRKSFDGFFIKSDQSETSNDDLSSTQLNESFEDSSDFVISEDIESNIPAKKPRGRPPKGLKTNRNTTVTKSTVKTRGRKPKILRDELISDSDNSIFSTIKQVIKKSQEDNKCHIFLKTNNTTISEKTALEVKDTIFDNRSINVVKSQIESITNISQPTNDKNIEKKFTRENWTSLDEQNLETEVLVMNFDDSSDANTLDIEVENINKVVENQVQLPCQKVKNKILSSVTTLNNQEINIQMKESDEHNCTLKSIDKIAKKQNIDENVEEQNIDENVEGQNIDDIMEEQNIDETVEEQNIDENVEEQNIDKTVEGQNIDENMEKQNVDETVEGQNIDETVGGQSIDETIEGQNIDENMEEQNVNEIVEKSNVYENVEEQNIDEYMEEQNIDEIVEKQNVEEENSNVEESNLKQLRKLPVLSVSSRCSKRLRSSVKCLQEIQQNMTVQNLPSINKESVEDSTVKNASTIEASISNQVKNKMETKFYSTLHVSTKSMLKSPPLSGTLIRSRRHCSVVKNEGTNKSIVNDQANDEIETEIDTTPAECTKSTVIPSQLSGRRSRSRRSCSVVKNESTNESIVNDQANDEMDTDIDTPPAECTKSIVMPSQVSGRCSRSRRSCSAVKNEGANQDSVNNQVNDEMETDIDLTIDKSTKLLVTSEQVSGRCGRSTRSSSAILDNQEDEMSCVSKRKKLSENVNRVRKPVTRNNKKLLSKIRNIKKNVNKPVNSNKSSCVYLVKEDSLDNLNTPPDSEKKAIGINAESSNVSSLENNEPLILPIKKQRIAHTPRTSDILTNSETNESPMKRKVKKASMFVKKEVLDCKEDKEAPNSGDKISSILEDYQKTCKERLEIERNLKAVDSNASTNKNIVRSAKKHRLNLSKSQCEKKASAEENNKTDEIQPDTHQNTGKKEAKQRKKIEAPVRELRSYPIPIKNEKVMRKSENLPKVDDSNSSLDCTTSIVSYLNECVFDSPNNYRYAKTKAKIFHCRQNKSFIFNQLQQLRDDKEWTNEIHTQVLETLVSSQDLHTIAFGIVEYADQDLDSEPPDKTHTPPAPIMTQLEQKLVTLIVSIDKRCPGFTDTVIQGLHHTIFKLSKQAKGVQIVERLFRILVVLNKIKKDREKIRIYLCDALYCLGMRAYNVIYVALMCWPEVLPKHSSNNDNILQTIVHILMSLQVDNTYPKVMSLKRLLSTYYEYPNSGYMSSNLKEQLLISLKENVPGTSTAILLLCKKMGPVWSCNNVFLGLKKIILNISHPSSYDILTLFGNIQRSFPKEDSTNWVAENINQLCALLDGNLGSQDFQEGIVSSLLSISKFGYEQIAKSVINWQSKWDLRESTKLKLKSFFNQHDAKWWKKFIEIHHPLKEKDLDK